VNMCRLASPAEKKRGVDAGIRVTPFLAGVEVRRFSVAKPVRGTVLHLRIAAKPRANGYFTVKAQESPAHASKSVTR
jgi:hypothetical protein